MTFKAVIFDFGGVFTTSPVLNFAKFETEHNLPKMFLGGVIKKNHHTNAWAKFERSEIDFDEFDIAFADETRVAGHEVTGKTLVGLLSLEFYPEMVDTLNRIKSAGYLTGCITNNLPAANSNDMVANAEEKTKASQVFATFDHIIESSIVGMRKPEPRIYQMMCDALGVTPGDCIFLDDLGINLKPARDLGMHTIKVSIHDVRPAITELEKKLDLSSNDD